MVVPDVGHRERRCFERVDDLVDGAYSERRRPREFGAVALDEERPPEGEAVCAEIGDFEPVVDRSRGRRLNSRATVLIPWRGSGCVARARQPRLLPDVPVAEHEVAAWPQRAMRGGEGGAPLVVGHVLRNIPGHRYEVGATLRHRSRVPEDPFDAIGAGLSSRQVHRGFAGFDADDALAEIGEAAGEDSGARSEVDDRVRVQFGDDREVRLQIAAVALPDGVEYLGESRVVERVCVHRLQRAP